MSSQPQASQDAFSSAGQTPESKAKPRAPKLGKPSSSTISQPQAPQDASSSTDQSSESKPKRRAPKLGKSVASSASQPQRPDDASSSADKGSESKARPRAPKLGKPSSSKDTSGTEAKSQEEAAGQQHHDSEAAKPDGESLTTILDPRQRTELTVLLAAATATMRDTIAATFDASISPAEINSETPPASRDKNKKPMTEDEKILDQSVDPSKADVAAFDRERRLLAAREKELSAPKMRELRDAALEWFDAWRISVIGRIGEAVNSDSKAAAKRAECEGEAHKAEPNKGAAEERKVDEEPPELDVKGAEEAEDDALKKLFPPIETPLAKLDKSKRALILHSVLLLFISLEHYPAPSRILLIYLARSLRLPFSTLAADEARTAQGLLEAAKEMSGDEETQRQAAANERNRKWKVRLAAAAGAAVVGITGGMAAPLVAAGVGSVMGGLGLGATAAAGYLGTVAGSSLVVGGLFGAYGGRMTGRMMDHYAREVEDFAFVPIRQDDKSDSVAPQKTANQDNEDEAGRAAPQDRRLRVTIGISGWLTAKEEVVKPWRVLGHGGSEVFALRWELESLMNLGHAIEAMLSSAAWGYAQKELIARSIFADMMAAMWPLGLLQVSRVVDNPFSIAKARAEKAGAVLADALVNRAQGERPVTLLGYSLGARVIYSCLLSLAARRAFGLVENVVLIGAPLPSDAADWRVLRTAVAGRLVNVFSTNDYVLGFLYRTSSVQLGVAGLQRVEGVPGVENVDVSEVVSGHLRYRHLVGRILRTIGFEDLDLDEIKREEEAFKKMLEEEQKQRDAVMSKVPKNLPKNIPTKLPAGISSRFGGKPAEGGKAADQAKGGTGQMPTEAKPDAEQSVEDAEKEAQSMEKSVQEKTQSSLMQYAAELLRLGYPTNATSAASEAVSNVARGQKDPKDAANVPADTKGVGDAGAAAGDSAAAAKASASSYTSKYQPYVIYANTYARQHWPFSTNSSKKADEFEKGVTGGAPQTGAEKDATASSPTDGAAPMAGGSSYLEMASDSWRAWGTNKGSGGAAATGQSYLDKAGQTWRSFGKGKQEKKTSERGGPKEQAETGGEDTSSQKKDVNSEGKKDGNSEEKTDESSENKKDESSEDKKDETTREKKAEEKKGDKGEDDKKDGQQQPQKSYLQSGASMLGLSK